MSYYKTSTEDLASYLLTVFPSKLSQSNVRFDSAEIFNNLPNQNTQVVFIRISDVPNAKWARDEVTIAIQVLGKDASKKLEASNLIWDINNHITAMDNLVTGDRTLFQVRCLSQPTFLGFRDNTTPVFTASYNYIVEYDNGIGNRQELA